MNSARRIVLCEDMLAIRVCMAARFRRDGFEVREFASGEAAWREIAADPPDLVVTDLGVEEIDGIELCRRIRASESLAAIPILLVTGDMDAWACEDFRERSGADRVLFKPFSPSELLRETEWLLGRAAPVRV
jgi:DNA-binding response OmpR family regulator